MHDIQNRTDVETMVNTFYDLIRADDLVGPIFQEIAQVDWDSHLPKMYDFWDSLLFGTAKYRGRPFPKHAPLPIDSEHFERWLMLFEENIKKQFKGPNTEMALLRAHSIAQIFQNKLRYLRM